MISFLDLKKVTEAHQDDIRRAVGQVVDSGWYLQGEAVRRFETDYARYTGTRHCIGVANGLDALTLIYRACIETGRLQPGDEVIVPANTYIATILAITENGLKPVLVEPDVNTLEMDDRLAEQAITPRTRSLLTVHLYGRCAMTERIARLCREHHLLLVEDNAQAHGCCYNGQRTGSLGLAAGHSFYPGKNLGALGDAGAVTTDDDELAQCVRALGNYGSSAKYVFRYKGRNSRMDELQAAVLAAKLRYLDGDNRRRQQLAARYYDGIDHPNVRLPKRLADAQNVYHLFPILCPRRDELQQWLAAQGVQTLIHYPIPPHRQQAYSEWAQMQLPLTEQIHREELSLPISSVHTDGEIDRVIDIVNHF